jgi:hypothetical protein
VYTAKGLLKMMITAARNSKTTNLRIESNEMLPFLALTLCMLLFRQMISKWSFKDDLINIWLDTSGPANGGGKGTMKSILFFLVEILFMPNTEG